MTWNILTVAFGGSLYKKGQRFLDRQSKKCGVSHIDYTDDDLFGTDFYEENKEYLSAKNGYGYFAWKPYFILKAMENLEEGDKIMYLDTQDIFHPDIFNFVDGIMDEDDPCLLPLGGPSNKQYTKKDCFVYMECDEEDYWDSPQLEAGFSFWKVCDRSKEILTEWMKWCLDERVNGEVTTFSNLPEDSEFKECRHDQSILTNLAVRDGLSVVGPNVRNLIECNADYWYQRHTRGGVQMYRPIDTYLVQIKDTVDYLKTDIVDSIILTLHNQEAIVNDVLGGIEDNTEGEYELIIVFDGCTDSTEPVAKAYIETSLLKEKITYKYADNVFETKANNIGLKEAIGEYVIIVQDDMVIQEPGWNKRMREPFEVFDDVFAVTARASHNYFFNESSQYLNMKEDLDNCWCDIVVPCDIADKSNIPRNVFAVRGTVNRGPLMINHKDLKKMDYFDESYSPLDMDDHDLMFRMHKKLGKVCGCYWIGFDSDPAWGGTRKETGEPAPWSYKAQHKNSKIFYERNADVLEEYRFIDDRMVK